MSSRLAKAFADGSLAAKVEADSWREAIQIAGGLLVQSGRTTEQYTADMISAIEDLGPYIVIAPGIALPHARPSEAVVETGLSLVTLAAPVEFGNSANDPVQIVIALAARDHDAHIETMSELATLLSDTENVNSLLNAWNTEQLRSVLEKRRPE